MRKRSPLAAVATTAQVPAPTGGWNVRDPLPEMAPTDAVILDNMIPGTGGVSLRGGTLTRNTGLPGPVRTLMRYFPASGAEKAFAASGSGFYDISAPGAVTTAAVSGLATDKWQAINFGTPGGYFLIAASGYDQPQIYNGSTWKGMILAAANGYAYTFDATKLMAPFAFGNRLYFIERGTLRVWYLPLYSIQATGTYVDGAGITQRVQADDANGRIPNTCVQVLDFASLFTMGGSLVAMADWTRDGGQGSDDYAVLITSAGQAAIYSGTNPNATDSTGFNLVGAFRTPIPIGTRCVIRAGADLALLTETGAVPFSSILSLSQSQTDQVALTDKIRGAFRGAVQVSGGPDGWELAEYPKGSLVIINVPTLGGIVNQYVMNVLTGAWCSLSGLQAYTFGLIGGALVFGTMDGRIVTYDVGSSDDGMPITGTVLPAFSAFRQVGKKRFLLARPLFFGPVGYKPAIRLNVDYDQSRPVLTQGTIPPSLTPWGSPWRSPWGTPIRPVNQWLGIRGVAQTASVLTQIVSVNPCRLDHIDVQFETGGMF
jgi:hypothetical protein